MYNIPVSGCFGIWMDVGIVVGVVAGLVVGFVVVGLVVCGVVLIIVIVDENSSTFPKSCLQKKINYVFEGKNKKKKMYNGWKKNEIK